VEGREVADRVVTIAKFCLTKGFGSDGIQGSGISSKRIHLLPVLAEHPFRRLTSRNVARVRSSRPNLSQMMFVVGNDAPAILGDMA